MLREIMKQAMALASGVSHSMGKITASHDSHDYHVTDWMNEDGDDYTDPAMAADAANDIVDLLSSLFETHDTVLTELLQERNLDGYTPFMAAVVFKVHC